MADRRELTARSGGAVLIAGWTAWWAWRIWPISGLSWHFFTDGSRWLLRGPRLDLYALHPELQIGPLSLLVAGLLLPLSAATAKSVALVVMAGVGPLLIAALAPLVTGRRRGLRLLLAAALVVPAWTVLAVRWGHLDDVLAMSAAVLALRAVVANRPVLAGAALGAGIAAKPWAVGFLPLVLAADRQRLRMAATATVGTLLAWAPFLIATTRTMTALHPPVALAPSSGLHAFGVRGSRVPVWGRTAQLLTAPLLAAGAALGRRWPGVLLVAIAVRLALDPQDNAYFIGSAVLAAAVFDLLGTSWTVPWTTLVTAVSLWQPFVHDYSRRLSSTTGPAHWWFAHPEVVGWIHLGWSMAACLLVLALPAHPDRQLGHEGQGWYDGRPTGS